MGCEFALPFVFSPYFADTYGGKGAITKTPPNLFGGQFLFFIVPNAAIVDNMRTVDCEYSYFFYL